MLLCMVIVFSEAVVTNLAQDAAPTGICNKPLGLATGLVEDDFITSKTEKESTSFAGRLGNADGAWCFKNDSISSQNAILTIDLARQRFVSGFASQGPPEKLHPKSYNHVVAYSAAYSPNAEVWTEFNGGNLFFDTDTNDTSDAINYFVSNTIVLTRYVKVNVTMQVSGSATVCLRFELYGCDTDVQPLTGMQAITTAKGKIEVNWNAPSADTTLEFDSPTGGIFKPTGYVVLYKPEESQAFVSTATTDMTLSLEDVRLGATYVIQLQCLLNELSVKCGSTKIEAYPPCPDDWTGGNEYHCFLYLSDVSSFEEAKSNCLKMDVDEKLGKLSYLLDDEERKFLATRILPDDVTDLWLIGDVCQENDDCCNILKKDGDGVFKESYCGTEELTSAICLRDHKGEGSRMRISAVKASNDGLTASVTWRYEGVGWKTDKLQAKMWTETSGEGKQTTLTFSTLEEVFIIKDLQPGVMYSLLLRPAPNIRTEEFAYKFIIINFGEGTESYGALLTPVPMSVYVIWSGTLKVTWEAAQAYSVSGNIKESPKYSISHQMAVSDAKTTEVIVESGYEFKLTPLAMRTTYIFRLGCFFAGVFHPCGLASVTTDPPDHIQREVSGLYTIYEVINTTDKTWFDAEEDCQQRSGHLSSLLNELEGKTLLKILPNRDAKLWTGAKLKRNGTSYWTDRNKITYLPMAKNSGVLPSKDSCCRALNEAGKLRLAGGKCEDNLPHICKYLFKDLMLPPSSLAAGSQTWNSFEISWQLPSEGWLPTTYEVLICQKEDPTKCKDKTEVRDRVNFASEDLNEFTEYDVKVQALLKPINVETASMKTVFTYPKSPVRFTISKSGEMVLETPMLVAIGMKDSKVIASVYQADQEMTTSSGDVNKVEISGLVPEEIYDLLIKDQDMKWQHKLSFSAVPSCTGLDVGVGSFCCRFPEKEQAFDAAKSHCRALVVPDSTVTMALWSPDSLDVVQDLAKKLSLDSNFWIDKPSTVGVEDLATEEECQVRSGDTTCCSYFVPQNRIVCSFCCSMEQEFVCAYEVQARLGQPTQLLPTLIGNASFQVQWSNPSDVTWNIRRYEVHTLSTEAAASTIQAKIVEGSTEVLFEELEYGTEYEVTVTPLGMKKMRGESSKLLVTTLDPRPPLTIVVKSNGVTTVSSKILVEKGRGEEEVDVGIMLVDPLSNAKRTVSVVRGRAQKAEVMGLELGAEYLVEMTPAASDSKKFNYSGTFRAFPSCAENQIQDGLVCLWAAEQSKTWKEAAEICRSGDGELLDFKTQKELTPSAKALIASQIKQRFWMDLSSQSGSSAKLIDGSDKDCAGVQESDIMCCTFEAASGGELDNLKCTCCSEPRPFACKSETKVNLGDIGEITVENVTTSSLTLGWTLALDTSWKKPSFLVTWESLSANEKRKKRAVDKQIVVKNTETTISHLKPGTSYQVGVAPYSEATQVGGTSKGTTVSTKAEVAVAGLAVAGSKDSGCTLVILKISCCVTVIVGSILTVFVFIATRMLYLDCLAQMFSELSILGAYLCILVSSAQSYSIDNECVRASPTLCVAVAALIQFFFQAVFLFMLLESMLICTVLKDYLPAFCAIQSPLSLMILGFGIPAILNIVLAAVARDTFTDGNDNCWLYLHGRAMLPSVVPVIVFCVITIFLLLSVFDSDDPRESLSKAQLIRGKVFLKTRWACFAVLAVTIVSYSTGMFGANNRDSILNYVFVGFSMALGVLLPLLRIRCDDQVKEHLKHGLFASLRDDVGGIRVTPAPDNYDPKLLKMAEFNTTKYKRQQLANLNFKKEESLIDPDVAFHR